MEERSALCWRPQRSLRVEHRLLAHDTSKRQVRPPNDVDTEDDGEDAEDK